MRDKDAIIRQLQQELQQAQSVSFSAQSEQAEAANFLQAAREQHEAETQDLVSKFSQAQVCHSPEICVYSLEQLGAGRKICPRFKS